MSSELEQFCILAKAQKGRACAALIQQVLSSSKIFAFGELLAVPSVTSLADTEHLKYLKTLELFAYGTWGDYRESCSLHEGTGPPNFIELNNLQATKLKQLTIVQLANREKIIAYSSLLRELDIESVRELEDLIIETIYAGVLSGKIDQDKGVLRVKWTIGRDVPPSQHLVTIINTLGVWRERCLSTLAVLEDGSNRVRLCREAGRDQQDKTNRITEEVRANLRDSMASGEQRGRDSDEEYDEAFPRRTAQSMVALHRRTRTAKRTRGGVTNTGSGSVIYDGERMDMNT